MNIETLLCVDCGRADETMNNLLIQHCLAGLGLFHRIFGLGMMLGPY